ncbi:spastin-like isoform X2 [Leptotrombidium deliense]|uniref:Spastin n=1 Tax=Leptotrombidium deliense TaxID=299467 RepID=A0A443SW43_9ACAR|nr:spastin-like isoform X2 [Leptotrombidium deliense]
MSDSCSTNTNAVSDKTRKARECENGGNGSFRGKRFLSYPLIVIFMLIKFIFANLYLLTWCVYDYLRAYFVPPVSAKERIGSDIKSLITMSNEKKAEAINLRLIEQKEHHKNAYEFISKALQMDEEENVEQKEVIIELYKRGLKELEKGIAIEFSEKEGPTWDRARKLREKMINNLVMVQDRLKHLATDKNVNKVTAQLSQIGLSQGRSQTLPRTQTTHKCVASTSARRNPATSTPPSTRRIPHSPSYQSISKTRTLNPLKPSSSTSRLNTVSVASKVASIRGIDKKLIQMIVNEIYDGSCTVRFIDIAGQETAKQALQEMVILPTLRPELFTGLRAPPKGLLLFGPPGNGKTMLAKAVAVESNSTFLNISASTLTSKWLGEGEKIVRALFAVARELQPTIIFIDEVDSLLTERRENEHEASRRLKTEFFIEFEGLHSTSDERILVMAATNRPQELDEAALRRFTKRVYVTLPDFETRIVLLTKLLKSHNNLLNSGELQEISELTDGYSGSDLTALAKDAAFGPIREMGIDKVKNVDLASMRRITVEDFYDSLKRIRKSVSSASLQSYEKWNQEYGDISI